jgi:integrase
MMAKWVKTRFVGVRYREHSIRKHGVQRDKYFSVRYKTPKRDKEGNFIIVDGKPVMTDKEEALGWASEGWTAEKAALELAKLKNAQKTGEGPITLQEKRDRQRERQEAEAREKALADKAAIPFDAIWTKYVEQCRADGKKSIDREEDFHRLWIGPTIGKRPLSEIAPIHLEKIKHEMAKAELSPRSIHYCLAVVRQVFNFAIRRDLFDGGNPVCKVKKPTSDNRRMRFLSQVEAGLLLAEVKRRSIDSWRITLLSLHCGMRFGEIAALTWADIDLERNTICIRNPKNGRTRHAYLTETVRAAILEMEPGGKSDLVFPDRSGQKRKAMSDAFDRAVTALKLNEGIDDPRQKIVFHSCRHSFASWLAEAGTPLQVIRELLGHKTLAMTERYSHLLPGTLQKAVQGLDNKFLEGDEAMRNEPQSASKAEVVRLM